jgi:hypothetical protein
MNCSDKDFVDFIDVSILPNFYPFIEMHWMETRIKTLPRNGFLASLHL